MGLLIVAGLFEVVWAVGLKYTEGVTRLTRASLRSARWWSASISWPQALRTISVGTGYAVWTGVGAVGTVLIGLFFLAEPRTAMRLISIALIVAGIVGLQLADGSTAAT